MGLRDQYLTGLALQLGNPKGLRGLFWSRQFDRFNRETVAVAVEASNLRSGSTAGVLGMGGGSMIRLLLERVGPKGRVHGVTVSSTMIEAARRQFQAPFRSGQLSLGLGTFTELPLGDNSLDALITVNTLYFIDELDDAFRELARVLHPGGRAVVGLADPKVMAAFAISAHGLRLRTVDEVSESLLRAGFAEVRHERTTDRDDASHVLVATLCTGKQAAHP